LENVSFSYPSRPEVEVLHDLSQSFEAGKTTALLGSSGSGKSTIMNLLLRFYDPVSGAVKLDDQNIVTLNLRWLRSQIGIVMQEPSLFACSVRENVEHGLIGTKYETETSDRKMGFTERLPEGYETLVGERGLLLSGGQKRLSTYLAAEFY
jgi:ATP-binding cassette subfamily B (MDR/TAP) protein 1